MNLKLLFITVFILSQSSLWGQVSCHISNPGEVQQSYGVLYKKALRQQVTRIAVLPTIVHQSNGTQVFTEADVTELIQKANQYFAPIQYEFYIANQGVRHVFNDEFYNLEIENENSLRYMYDVDYAINLYFLHTIRKPNKDIISGFTSLPSLNGLSNRIMLSYLDKNKADFESLRDKIFPHELGHYFGLLHTFQESNNEDISQRELVTRAIGSNCSTTGDYLCDTEADPYERFPSISTLGCDNTLPSIYTDALGSTYTPPTNNIMSYNIRCDHVFTPQQYERMQASGSVRFSPAADYQIVLQKTNSITIGSLTERQFCEGETISFDWAAHGFFGQNNSFRLEFTTDGVNSQSMNAAFVSDEVFVQIPKGIEPNKSYRMRIVSSNPIVESPWSEHFEIQNIGTAELSSSVSNINAGEQVDLNLKITGSGPWDVTLSDGTVFSNLRKSEISFSRTPISNTVYNIVSISNTCGNLDKKGLVDVTISEPRLVTNGGAAVSVCEQGFLELPVNGLTDIESANYRVHLSGNQEFIVIPVVANNRLNFSIPRELEASEEVSLQVKGDGLANFSLPIELKILERPRQPFIQSPVTFCFDTTNAVLSAEIEEENQTRWYNENLSLIGEKGLIRTSTPGISNYFVSQITNSGCESEKSKVEVEIREPVQANISGDQNIFRGDSAQLKLDITGQGPFEVVLNDGSTLLIDQPSLLYYVKPSNSFIYEIKHVKNECGFGSVAGTAEVEVTILLSNENLDSPKSNIYPNPSNGEFFVKKGILIESVYDLKGAKIHFTQEGGRVYINQLGVLFISYLFPSNPHKVITKKVFIK